MRHPGWTYQDLQDTPADIIRLIRFIEQSEASAQEARSKREALNG